MSDKSISELTKIRVHGLKRKAPSTVGSSSPSSVAGKRSKRRKSEDAVSEHSDSTDLDNTLFVNEEFEQPSDFLQLDTSQLRRDNGVLFSEDLTDDYEFWTLQCPDDVDVNQLLEKSINFNEVSTIKVKNSLSYKVDLIPYSSQEGTNMTIVVPSESTKNLSLNVVPLAGTLIMSNRVKKEKLVNQNLLPVDTIEAATRRRSELMSKIIHRLSNKFDDGSVHKISIKEEFKMESVSPKKVKKRKHKTLG